MLYSESCCSSILHTCLVTDLCPIFVTPCTVARQAPLSMGFSRQEYWSGLPCLPVEDLPNPGIELVTPLFPALLADSLPTEPSGKPHFIYSSVYMLTQSS